MGPQESQGLFASGQGAWSVPQCFLMPKSPLSFWFLLWDLPLASAWPLLSAGVDPGVRHPWSKSNPYFASQDCCVTLASGAASLCLTTKVPTS